MTVIVSSKEVLSGLATPIELGTPAIVVNIPSQPDEYVIEGYIDLSSMLTGDEVIIEEFIAVDGTNQNLYIYATFKDAQEEPIIRFNSKIIKSDGKYKVQITQTAGTLRQFPYYFVKLNFGVV